MNLKKIKSSEIFKWINTFYDHTKAISSYEEIVLTALAYEKSIADNYPDTDVFEHELDSAFIDRFKNDPFSIKMVFEGLIRMQLALEDSFPLLGSMLQQFRKSVEEVRILAWQH